MGDLSGPVLAALVQNCADTWIFGHGSLFLTISCLSYCCRLYSYFLPTTTTSGSSSSLGGGGNFQELLAQRKSECALVPPPDTASVKRERWLDGRLLTSNNC